MAGFLFWAKPSNLCEEYFENFVGKKCVNFSGQPSLPTVSKLQREMGETNMDVAEPFRQNVILLIYTYFLSYVYDNF